MEQSHLNLQLHQANDDPIRQTKQQPSFNLITAKLGLDTIEFQLVLSLFWRWKDIIDGYKTIIYVRQSRLYLALIQTFLSDSDNDVVSSSR
jgi:hypothetical protein